ncbi:MAG: sodium:solute symporter family protein [Rickettsiaceae bacterium]|nr:sodium:solute symporter family protein [Rickettsiaceae bacterium]
MIDIFIVLAYLLLVPIISIFNKRKQNNFQSFTKISKKLKGSKLILVATIFASAIGGGTTFGVSEKVFSDNVAYSYGLMAVIPLDILIAIYILPKLIVHYKSETIGDIMFSYYGNSGRYLGGMSAILVATGFLAAQIGVSGRIFEYILQIDYITGVIMSYSIIIIYTTIGGLQSILFANQLQFFAIIFAIPLISIFGIREIGLVELINNFPLDKISFKHNPVLIQSSISAALGFAVINLLPTFVQRALINKDSNITITAVYIKSFIYFIFLIFVTLNGIIAFIYQPDIKSSLALPYLIDQIIPVGIQGIVVVGLLAAVMSTADSDLNIISITLTKDIIQPLFSVEGIYLARIARIANVLIGIVAIVIALNFSKIVDLVIFVSGFWGPITLIPLIMGLYNIKISKYGYITSVIIGIITFLLWHRFIETELSLKSSFIGTLANLVIFMIFYICSRVKKLISQSK